MVGQILILLLTFTLVMSFMLFTPDTDYHHPRSFLLKILFIVALSIQLYFYLPLTSILVCYALCSACYLSMWDSLNYFCSRYPKKNHVFLHGCAVTFVDLVVLVFLFLYLPCWKHMIDIIPIVAIVGCVLTFIPRTVNCKRKGNVGIRFYGISGNSSVNCTLMSMLSMASLASTIPYLGVIGWVFGVIGTIKSLGSAGLGGVILGSTVYWLYISPLYVGIVYSILILTAPLWWQWSINHFKGQRHVLFGVKLHPLFGLSDRDRLWKFAWDKLYMTYSKASWKHKWFGIGNGTFQYAMPAVQVRDKDVMYTDNKSLLTWLHNDCLQWLIEGGIIGCILLIFSVIEVFYLSHNDPVSVGFFLCFLVNCIANFSFRMASDTFIAVLMFKRLLM